MGQPSAGPGCRAADLPSGWLCSERCGLLRLHFYLHQRALSHWTDHLDKAVLKGPDWLAGEVVMQDRPFSVELQVRWLTG